MTILVIGRSGQLATALVAQAGGRDLVAVGRSDIDFDEPETILRSLTAHAPTLIIIAAAYTAVDRAETEAEAAYRANATGPEIVAFVIWIKCTCCFIEDKKSGRSEQRPGQGNPLPLTA